MFLDENIYQTWVHRPDEAEAKDCMGGLSLHNTFMLCTRHVGARMVYMNILRYPATWSNTLEYSRCTKTAAGDQVAWCSATDEARVQRDVEAGPANIV